jgi:site-specific recombinase XerD
MNYSKGLRKAHFKDNLPNDPQVKRWGQWLPDNRQFHGSFLRWLHQSGYSDATIHLYSVASRQAFGFLDKPFWTVDPDEDLQRVWEHLQTRPLTPNTLRDHHKGLVKLAEYLRLRCHKPPPPKTANWEFYIGTFPQWLAEDVRAFVTYRRRAWPPERQHEHTYDLLSHLTRCLRWLIAHGWAMREIGDLTPDIWYAYVDERLVNGIKPVTVNGELLELQHFLRFLDAQGRSICPRMLLVETLARGDALPRDAPPEQLRRLFQEIQAEATAFQRGRRRAGRMDCAWFLLMLHSGLRTCEVRSLTFADLDLENCRARIEQSKGLKDRMVYLSQATVAAIRAYLEVRGPEDALPEQVFLYAHKPLSRFYCGKRLHTYGRRCGVQLTPHQLRHSCATLLLNAGAPVLTVQMLLGHKHVDTTLGYARLYDGTVAADYYAAMASVEKRLALPEDRQVEPAGAGQLLALVDSLRAGTLNPTQLEAVRALRTGLMALAERENVHQDIKVATLDG